MKDNVEDLYQGHHREGSGQLPRSRVCWAIHRRQDGHEKRRLAGEGNLEDRVLLGLIVRVQLGLLVRVLLGLTFVIVGVLFELTIIIR